MNIYELIKTRKSVRAFTDAPVEEEKLQRILEAGRMAPSAKNFQEWRFVVVRDKENRRRLAEEAAGQAWVGTAPVVIACCAETDGHTLRSGQLCYPVDVSIAIDHMTLAAVHEGLGTCWIGSINPDTVREILGIPRAVEVVELLPLGYPADPSPVSKKRLALEEIVHREGW